MKDDKPKRSATSKAWSITFGLIVVVMVTVSLFRTPTLTDQVTMLSVIALLGVGAVVDHIGNGNQQLDAIAAALERIERHTDQVDERAAAHRLTEERRIKQEHQMTDALQLLEAILAHQPPAPHLGDRENRA